MLVIDRAKDVLTPHDGTKFSPQFIEKNRLHDLCRFIPKAPVNNLILQDVQRTNADLPNVAKIKHFLLLHKELDAELTRTRKVRRCFVAQRYKELIDGLYGRQ